METVIPGGIPTNEFLEFYWQKKPCLLRRAFPEYQADFDKQRLLETACLSQVESRVVLEKDGDYPWQVLQGVFNIEDFEELPLSHWSLLVQNAEHYFQSASSLLSKFNFIPNWRIDDLMISYAPDAGSVGPHFDSYDVFLFQAKGQRKWSINCKEYKDSDCIDGLDLRIIEDFQADEEYILEPGDMLYLPPGTGHHGVAIGESITCSIGFRAPSNHELLAGFVDYVLQNQMEIRYSDPELRKTQYSGELREVELQKIDSLFRSTLPEPDALADWFGRFISSNHEMELETEVKNGIDRQETINLLKKEKKLCKPSELKAVFIRKKTDIVLYICGKAFRSL